MALIISETFPSGDNKGLQLDNEEWGRVMSIGSDWTRLRIGMLCNMTPDGTNNITAAQVRMGLSTSAADHIGSDNATHWCGMLWGAQSTALTGGTWSYVAGSGNPYFTASGNGRVRVLNGTRSGGTNAGGFIVPTNGGANLRKRGFFVELQKESAGTVLAVGGGSAGIISTKEHTLAQFRAYMADGSFNLTQNSAGAIDGDSYSANGNTDFTDFDTNESTYGALQAVHVGWNKSLNTLLQVFCIEAYRHG